MGYYCMVMESPTPPPARPSRSGLSSGRILQTTLSVALILATLFTCISPSFFSLDLNSIFSPLLTPQAPDA